MEKYTQPRDFDHLCQKSSLGPVSPYPKEVSFSRHPGCQREGLGERHSRRLLQTIYPHPQPQYSICSRVPWARCVGAGEARPVSAGAASACYQAGTPQERSVQGQPGCCVAGCSALWEWGHDWDVGLEQDQVPLRGAFARVLFELREMDSGELTMASHLSWAVLSLSKLICHFLLNVRGGRGSKKGPRVTALRRPGQEGRFAPQPLSRLLFLWGWTSERH